MKQPRNFYDYREVQELRNHVGCGEHYEPLTEGELYVLLDTNITLSTCCVKLCQHLEVQKNKLGVINDALMGVRLYRIPFTNLYITNGAWRIARAKKISRLKT